MPQPITPHLTKGEIDAVFASRDRADWGHSLDAYEYLRRELARADTLPDYERRFNYFYQVRRNAAWRGKFYTLFHDLRRGADAALVAARVPVDFAHILRTLHRETGQVEASFASKLAATLDPALPVIDRHVLSYIGAKLPPAHWDPEARMARVTALYGDMTTGFQAFLETGVGRHLLARFRREYPERVALVSDMKMLDFVLWQSGGKGR